MRGPVPLGYHARRREVPLQQTIDIYTPSFRTPELHAAVASLADQGDTERGAVFTRREVVLAMLDLAEYTSELPIHQQRLLEPSFGGGDFLRPAVERLLAAFVKHGGTTARVRELKPAIRAVEVHQISYEATRARLLADLRAWGTKSADASALCDAWLVCDDFLLTQLPGPFDVVVRNPPYVRQERIAGPLLAEYRRRYATIYDRADLYVPFFERGLISSRRTAASRSSAPTAG